MGFQGITQHGKFARCGLEKAIEEVINLGGIDGEEGEAGVQMFPTLIIGGPATTFASEGSAQRR